MKCNGLVTKSLVLSAFSLVLLLILPFSLLYAEEAGALLEQIRFDRQSSSRETVTFKLNGPHIPKIFALKGEAPKVVFDFYDTRHSPAIKGVMNSRGNLVSAIRTGMHNEPQLKTRVVLDMVPGGDYDFAQDFEIQSNTLEITIFHVGQKDDTKQALTAAAKKKKKVDTQQALTAATKSKIEAVVPVKVIPPPVVAVKEPTVLSSQLLIKKISFEKSPDKGEKVLFELKNFHPPVVFGNEEGATPSIVCDFMASQLGDEVPDIIPAKGQFVKQVRVEKSADSSKIRVVLELVPNRHYDLQQVFFKEQDLYVLFVNSSESAAPGSDGRP